MSENKWPGKLVKGGRKELINTREGVREEESEERGEDLAGQTSFVTHREIERL